MRPGGRLVLRVYGPPFALSGFREGLPIAALRERTLPKGLEASHHQLPPFALPQLAHSTACGDPSVVAALLRGWGRHRDPARRDHLLRLCPPA